MQQLYVIVIKVMKSKGEEIYLDNLNILYKKDSSTLSEVKG